MDAPVEGHSGHASSAGFGRHGCDLADRHSGQFKAEVAHLLNQLTIEVCASAAVARRSH